jgi:hypothetical protein
MKKQNLHFPAFKNQKWQFKKAFNPRHELTPYFFGKISRKIRIADCFAQKAGELKNRLRLNPIRKKAFSGLGLNN